MDLSFHFQHGSCWVLLLEEVKISRELLILLLNILNCALSSLSRKHESIGSISVVLLQLLDSISVSKGVESVLAAGLARTHVTDHDCFTVAYKRVLEDLSQFRASERCVLLVLVQGSDTLLQSKQRLVDFSSVDSSLFLLVHVVRASLTSCQINK